MLPRYLGVNRLADLMCHFGTFLNRHLNGNLLGYLGTLGHWPFMAHLLRHRSCHFVAMASWHRHRRHWNTVWCGNVPIQQELSDIASQYVPDTGVHVGHAGVGGQDVVLRYRPQLQEQLHALSGLGVEGQHYWDVVQGLELVEQARLMLLGVERAK